ncbi:hypothetical protein TVAG_005710 [Trichomonas vaginalis G3]|uniref:Uncharacterized protein n=1 Tax=Trichomonas vaginalis (strain ATCC PRA-98 / G3) TaxID=412133 RepID=A2FHQ6_TRIV3|nr:hypothetical protein TVAGG3_0554390 [Trichomonas vaginalis G3]EAX95556.1 hypothetical protein TVAG_005710 [Trichomonas vaginalis G3]KAI5520760.1 hypothetical protein TVAGG3_0554390 [Trichomonas vaginalis G3]|eukprot:XP_001308486.1 hypothetical protein [Trichomonas vaginalis G3]
MKSFVKLPGPIEFVDDSDDDLFIVKTVQKSKNVKINPKQTPKSTPISKHSEKKIPETEIKPPADSSLGLSPKLSTPQSSPKRESHNTSSILRSPVPSPKQISQHIQTSTFKVSEDTKNYSTILKQKSPVVAENTEEATIEETYRQLYKTHRQENLDLLAEKFELEKKLRRTKLECQKRLAKQREANKVLKSTLDADLMESKKKLSDQEGKLKISLENRNTDAKYSGLQTAEHETQNTLKSFKDAKEIVEAVTRILKFSPLSEADFLPILSTFDYSSDIGRKLEEFINIAKVALSDNQ